MKTHYYKIGTGDDNAELNEAGRIIREDGLCAFPTETVYGLGGNAYSAESSEKIYAAKGRPSDNPLIVHVASPEEADDFAYTNDTYRLLANEFMPGPLTVILPKKDNMPYSTTGGLDTVAVRCPFDITARKLIKAAGVPIAAPSANLSGKPSPTCAEDVAFDMNGRIEMLIDGGECEIGLESTVIALDGDKVKILRPGAVTPEMFAEIGLSCEVDGAVISPEKAGDHPASPGMKYKHYAPNAPLYLVEGDTVELKKAAEECADKPVCVLCRTEEIPEFAGYITLDTGMTYKEFSHRLFNLLRRADETGAKTILAHLPDTNGIGLALYNRIIRSAAGKIIRKK